MHLRHVKYNPNGGPDGGDGGNGGSVILRGNHNYWTLLHLKYQRHVFAEHGGNGGRDKCHGTNGKNAYKCNSHDVAYLLMCYTKRGRKQLSVTVAKTSYLCGLIVDVMHRITCNLRYGLEYTMVRQTEATETTQPAPAEQSKTETEKPETAPELESNTDSDEDDVMEIERPAPTETVESAA